MPTNDEIPRGPNQAGSDSAASGAKQIKPNTLSDAVGVLSNPFLLLVLGSAITYFLVPRFQHNYEERSSRVGARKECLSQFLLYSNLRWQEFYLTVPLVVEAKLDINSYKDALQKLSAIRIQRYDAFAKVRALALSFRQSPNQPNTYIEETLVQYAKDIDNISNEIARWLKDFHCLTYQCIGEEQTNPYFDPHASFNALEVRMVELLKKDDDVARVLANSIVAP